MGNIPNIVKALRENEEDIHTKHRDEMYKQVGRVTVALSNVENIMATIFMVVSMEMKPAEASPIFYSYQSFDQKLRLVDYAVRRSGREKEYKRWLEVTADLKKHKVVRNIAAHQGMRFKQRNDGTHIKVVLASPWFSNKGKELEINDLKAAADGLDAIAKELWEFLRILGGP